MHMRSMMRRPLRIAGMLAVLLAVALIAAWLYLRASLPLLDGAVHASGLAAPVSVARDDYGVPLISGADRIDVAYATGFVHAQERYFQMDLLRRVGAGELAELFGARAIKVDRAHRLHRFRARAELALAAMSADDRRFLDRYVAGVNDGLARLAAHPFEYRLIGVQPRAWQAADSLLVVCAMYFDLQGNLEPRELARGWVAQHSSAAQRAFLLPESSAWDALLDGDGSAAPTVPIPPTAPAWWGKPKQPGVATIAAAEAIDAVGSNNWAIAGARSKDGAAIVADDMHLGLQLPNIWYRLALRFPDAQGKARRVVGVTQPGAPPVVVVGSNGRVAWGFSNSYGDYLDLVELGVDGTRPGQVRTPGGWETPAVHAETILVKGAASEKMAVRDSSLGPIRVVGDKTYAVHWMAHGAGALNLKPRQLETVDTVDDALAIANTLGIPAQNFIAGDDRGNIGWTIAGVLARRAQPGVAATFPLAQGGAQASFDGALAPHAYPRLVNPAAGQLSSANSRQLQGDGARLIGDGGFDLGARHRQVREGLLALGAQVDVAAAYGVALDDRALFIAQWRERALGVLDAPAIKGKPQRAQFLALLQRGWTGHASADSAGYLLARQFMFSLHDLLYGRADSEVARLDDKATMALASSRWPVVVARLLDEQPAAWLPPGYANWRALQLAAVDRAIEEVTRDGTALADATWGRRNKAAIAHPISAAAPWLRFWLAAPQDRLPGDANMPRVAGNRLGQSERMTVTPGKEEQGVFNMPGGQSGHPLSPYFLAGHQAWVQGKMLPLLPGAAQHTLLFSR
ncbi:penicillin acylase family protein [Massilia sp. TSP1-1-2]|uniref:penicillin acylase family protein n=1 Tax=Massilia sp. TSP1-1-2 TaxID=2804649 RepID=UPI003CF88B41